ncbi:MAG: helix-turn-helix domain-containing protein [Pseudomonadota bacterium]
MSRKTKRPRNKRLKPDVRKDIILDKTAALIAREGISAVSMERVAREAEISKPLVYVYFSNKTTLLRELLLREQHRLSDLQAKAVSKAKDFEDLIRLTTRTYLKHVEANGVHIQRLMNEPSVSVAFEEEDRKGRRQAVEFLASEVSRSFGVPRKTAELAAELSMGMTGFAGEMISRGVVSRRKIEEINICLAMGCVAALTDKYGKAPTPSKA